MTRPRSKIRPLWLGVTAIIAAIVILNNPTEPRVQEKRVSEWLDEIAYAGNAPGVSVPRSDPAFKALASGGPGIAENLAKVWIAGHHDSATTRMGDRWNALLGRNRGTHSRANRGWCAWEILTEMGPTASNAAPVFLAALGGGSRTRRSEAMFALGRIRALPERAVPAIMESLEDTDPKTVWVAARALGFFGQHARPALARLETLRSDKSVRKDVQLAAIAAISRIDPDQTRTCMDELIAELRKPPSERDTRTPFVLGDMGRAAHRAVPALLEMIEQEVQDELPPQTEMSVWLALQKIDPEAYEAEYERRGGDAIDREWNRER